jgi:hypothetical protein
VSGNSGACREKLAVCSGKCGFITFASLAASLPPDASGAAAILLDDSDRDARQWQAAAALASAWIKVLHRLFPSQEAASAWAALAGGGAAAPAGDAAALQELWARRWAGSQRSRSLSDLRLRRCAGSPP